MSAGGGDDDFWVIRIPKPKKILKMLARLFTIFPTKSITIDIPFITITSLLIAVVLFIFFTTLIKIPEVVAAVFSTILVGFYLYILRSEMRR